MTNIYDELKADLKFDPEERPAPLPLPTLAATVLPETPAEIMAPVVVALAELGEAGLLTEGLAELKELVDETVVAAEEG